MATCLKCDDTGFDVDGNPCECGIGTKMEIPLVIEIPRIYQSIVFSRELLPMDMPIDYGLELEDIMNEVMSKGRLDKNILVCSPPNTGKTVLSYTLYRTQWQKGLAMPELMDLIEAKEIINYGGYDEETIKDKDKLVRAPLAIIKLPMDLPNKFAETISSIVERRVRKNGTTLFLYGGSIKDLTNQDRFGVLRNTIRDGSYNSLKVVDYQYNRREVVINNENN